MIWLLAVGGGTGGVDGERVSPIEGTMEVKVASSAGILIGTLSWHLYYRTVVLVSCCNMGVDRIYPKCASRAC